VQHRLLLFGEALLFDDLLDDLLDAARIADGADGQKGGPQQLDV
jgi:hypothetical protein